MNRLMILSGIIVATALIAVTPAFALDDELQEAPSRVRSETTKKAETTTNENTGIVRQAVDKTEVETGEQENRKQLLEERKNELSERIEQRNAERKTKLEGRRLAQCQNRQEAINALMVKGTENGRRHFENIASFEAQVLAFAEKKSVSGGVYDAALTDVAEKKNYAENALSVIGQQEFDCENLDGAKPSEGVKTIREAKRDALRAYRDSVIQLIKIVKAEFAASQADASVTRDDAAAQDDSATAEER
ncbi:hypothetical protein H7142_03055 [Candidatus Saccharibacteria bacterium]|nr:hypothetical protein [Candidatus Saccharibacteria bacterium]